MHVGSIHLALSVLIHIGFDEVNGSWIDPWPPRVLSQSTSVNAPVASLHPEHAHDERNGPSNQSERENDAAVSSHEEDEEGFSVLTDVTFHDHETNADDEEPLLLLEDDEIPDQPFVAGMFRFLLSVSCSNSINLIMSHCCDIVVDGGEHPPAVENPLQSGDGKRPEPVAVPEAVEGKAILPDANGPTLRNPRIAIANGRYRVWWRLFLLLRAWTLIFGVSTRCSEMLYRIMKLMIPQMKIGISNFIVDKTLGLDRQNDAFVAYASCPKCYHVTTIRDAYHLDQKNGHQVSNRCENVLLRNHKQERFRVCGEILMRHAGSLDEPSGALVPFLTYAYRPVKTRLVELLNRPGLEKMCERWRDRDVPAGQYGDIYDGAVWREEFQYVGGVPFLAVKGAGNYALAIFCDWFQPWKRVQYSVGVLFACLLNLPREERHKKDNLFVIGVFPGGTEKNLNLNSLLRPFVDEMKELHPKRGGVRMATHEVPEGHNVAVVCMMAVCDLPAGKKLAGFVNHNGDYGCSRCDKKWTTTSVVVNGDARVDGEGVSDDDDDDEEPIENESKEEKKDVAPVEEEADVVYDEWAELADADVIETVVEDADSKRESKADRKVALLRQSSSSSFAPRSKRRGAPGARPASRVRTWRRVYAKPAELGRARDITSHRKAANAWRNAATKREQATLAKGSGVKWSVLLELDYWDPIRHVIVDSLHCFWLGICRTLMKKWRDEKWSNGKALDTMQKRLNAMRVPADVCWLLNKWASNMSGLTGHQVKAFVSCSSRSV